MTSKQYRAALARLGLSQAAAGRLLGVSHRQSKRYAASGIAGPPEKLLQLLLSGAVTREQLEDL
jgi:hypothetical protein